MKDTDQLLKNTAGLWKDKSMLRGKPCSLWTNPFPWEFCTWSKSWEGWVQQILDLSKKGDKDNGGLKSSGLQEWFLYCFHKDIITNTNRLDSYPKKDLMIQWKIYRRLIILITGQVFTGRCLRRWFWEPVKTFATNLSLILKPTWYKERKGSSSRPLTFTLWPWFHTQGHACACAQIST